jgi:hypothetical protein
MMREAMFFRIRRGTITGVASRPTSAYIAVYHV